METTLFYNCQLFDGKNPQIQPHSWFLVNPAGQINARGQGTTPPAEHRVDLHNQYVMPGLINCHTHLCLDPDAFDGDTGTDKVTATVRAVQNAQTMLRSGVTYVRECGSIKGVDITLSQLIEQQKLTHVPQILPAGLPFSMTGGHGSLNNGTQEVDSPDEMRQAVRQALKQGAQVIKVMATGGVMSPADFMNDPQLSTAEMRAAVLEAHHRQKTVAAHAEGNPGILNAIEAGVDSIEHGFYVNDAEIDLMLKQHTFLTPTFIAAWAIPRFGQGILPNWEIKKAADALDDLYQNINHAYQRQVPITLGTDAGTCFNYFDQTPKELELMVDHGFSNFDALQTSWHSAQLMQIAEHYGTLEEQKFADFLVLTHNPLEDICAVQQVNKQVYQKGNRVA